MRARIVGGGNPNAGQCTITVVVDGKVQVDVLGADGMLRNLGGGAPQWRRFECTSALPSNPANFQFAGVDGRGRQDLTSEPRNGGPAVVRIEDSDGGASEYTFRLAWSNGQDRGPSARNDRGRDDRGPSERDDRGFQGDRDRPGDHRQDEDVYHRDRDVFFRGNGYRQTFFQRVREDLDHATSGAFPFTGDRARLDRTKFELNELQQKLAQGYFDERELDETMASLQAVVEGNRLAPDDRAMLTDDLNRMRDFRTRHDDYGARRTFDRNRGDRRATFFQDIREDLERATADSTYFRGDRQRLGRATYQLNDLQAKMSRGVYDERELNEVVVALQRVVDSNRLSPRDRNILAEDLKKLDDFRLRRDRYGVR
ncbi:MAG: hypothetical protein ABI833_09030 [Acidobacteriota bacterium]